MGLTSMTCKLLKLLIKYHTEDVHVIHKLLHSFQHGLLIAKSCLTKLYVLFLEDITKWVFAGSPVDMIS